MISKKAQEDFSKLLSRLDGLGNNQIRDALLEYVPAITDKYGNASAALAAQFYESIRYEEIEETYNTVLAPPAKRESVESSVRWAVGFLFSAGVVALATNLGGSIGRHATQPAHQTMLENSLVDPRRPLFARVPMSSKPCGFCVSIASQGFVYASRESAGEFDQYHDNCQCMVIPSWDKNPLVDGYRPWEYELIKEYPDEWYNLQEPSDEFLSKLAKGQDPSASYTIGKKGAERFYFDNGNPIYPGNRGFIGKTTTETLIAGSKIVDRYGHWSGRFASPQGTPFSQRSLPRTVNQNDYHAYNVLRDFDVVSGKAAPWFGKSGNGVQYELPKKISDLIDVFLGRL